QAIRLSPRESDMFNFYARVGQAHLLLSQITDAIAWFEMARSDNPDHQHIRGFLASAYALNGETERAMAEFAEARRLGLFRTVSGRLQDLLQRGVKPEVMPLYEATYFPGLRKLGMPEE